MTTRRPRPALLCAALASLLAACTSTTSPLPLAAVLPAVSTDITTTGVLPDGTTLNTAALQKAIDTCSANGGGTLHFPEGRYLTGTIQLKDNVTLHLDEKAVILGSTKAADYRNVDPFIDGTGAELGYALIVTTDAKHVGITGPGTIDGQGTALKATQEKYTIRPFLVRWVRCSDITVKDVQLKNSGAWTMHFFQSQNAAVTNVNIRSRGLANNDGIDIDSSNTIRIRDCDIDTGDDAICLKATSPKGTHDIDVADCKLKTNCNAIKLGTESLGDFEKIRIANCQIRDTNLAGIALYTVDGAHLHDVLLSDITMTNVMAPISIRLGARLKTFRTGDTAKPIGRLYDVTIKNLHATGSRQIGILMNGLPNHPIENVTLDNVDIEVVGGGRAEDAKVELAEKEATYPEIKMFGPIMPAHALYMRHAKNITFTNVKTSAAKPDPRPATIFLDVENMQTKP